MRLEGPACVHAKLKEQSGKSEGSVVKGTFEAHNIDISNITSGSATTNR